LALITLWTTKMTSVIIQAGTGAIGGAHGIRKAQGRCALIGAAKHAAVARVVIGLADAATVAEVCVVARTVPSAHGLSHRIKRASDAARWTSVARGALAVIASGGARVCAMNVALDTRVLRFAGRTSSPDEEARRAVVVACAVSIGAAEAIVVARNTEWTRALQRAIGQREATVALTSTVGQAYAVVGAL
jgi:hypothetical protein